MPHARADKILNQIGDSAMIHWLTLRLIFALDAFADFVRDVSDRLAKWVGRERPEWQPPPEDQVVQALIDEWVALVKKHGDKASMNELIADKWVQAMRGEVPADGA